MWAIRQDLKAACAAIREELDGQLDAINANTQEVASSYDIISELDFKIQKLTERLDRLEMHIRPEQTKPAYLPLTHREQETFSVLYATSGAIDAQEIGRRLGLPADTVMMLLTNLCAKGVPILQRIMGSTRVFYVDEHFKLLQARENVLRISPQVINGLVAEQAV